jgi:hypothetical protein
LWRAWLYPWTRPVPAGWCTAPRGCTPLSTQSAGPVRFMTFCSISMFLLAGRRLQGSASAEQQGMYSTIPILRNMKPPSGSPGISHVGPVLYVFSLLGVRPATCTVKNLPVKIALCIP